MAPDNDIERPRPPPVARSSPFEREVAVDHAIRFEESCQSRHITFFLPTSSYEISQDRYLPRFYGGRIVRFKYDKGMTICIVTEKPSVGRDIAESLGRPTKHEGYLTVGEYVITWAFGHLVTLANPEVYSPTWKSWNWATLPMLPEDFELRPIPKTRAQLGIIKRLASQADSIICATDADREGELIFRYIYRVLNLVKPVRRLWLSENTATAIKKALKSMEPWSFYDDLAAAAGARSQADWLVGLNATRAFTLKHGTRGQGALSVGRVQTPTLRLIRDRDLAIDEFVAEQYWQVKVTFEAPEGTFVGTWFTQEGRRVRDRLSTSEEAQAIAAKVTVGSRAVIRSVKSTRVTLKPPLLFSLNDLQKEAHRRFGLTAQETLDTAQSLYDKHLTSYPRTDAKYVTGEISRTLDKRIQAIAGWPGYRDLVPRLAEPWPIARLVDEAKVAAAGHYAIIPTGQKPSTRMSDREGKVLDLIVRRLMASLMPSGIDERTTLITEAEAEMFRSQGTVVVVPGWRLATQVAPKDEDEDGDDVGIPPGLRADEEVLVARVDAPQKETKAPPRLNDASLLALMEKHGLGTPATRARIVEVLLARDYVARVKKTLESTDKGKALLTLVPETIQSPELTGVWESRLEAVAEGSGDAVSFMQDIRAYTSTLVETARAQESRTLVATTLGVCPLCRQGQVVQGRKAYGCSRWREGCKFTIWSTIAGKKITVAQVKKLLAGQTIGPLKGFKSKAGRAFSARLRLDLESMRVEFVFESPLTATPRRRTTKRASH